MSAPQTENATEAPLSQSAQATEIPWPRPDFERQVQRLRAELWTAIRLEKQKSDEIAALENQSFSRSLPIAALAGPGKLEKLAREKDAATLSAHQARVALRQFIDGERGRFGELKNEAHRRLQAEISEKFARAQAAGAVLLELLHGLLGGKAEAETEEEQIRKWNRGVRNLNRTIPAENINNIPTIPQIGTNESIRGNIESMILADRNLRELARDFLTRQDESRQRAEANREFLEQQAIVGTIHDDAPFARRV